MRYIAEFSGHLHKGAEIWVVRDTGVPEGHPQPVFFRGLKVSREDAQRFAQEWNTGDHGDPPPRNNLRILRKGRLEAPRSAYDDWEEAYRSETRYRPGRDFRKVA